VPLYSIVIFNTPAYAMTEAKGKDIKILLNIIGVPSMAKDMADFMVAYIIDIEKKRNPDLPKNIENSLSKIIYNSVIELSPELNSMAVPLYDKYYTHEDIKNLITFFRSPIGKKYLAVSGSMMKDMMPIAQAWGKKIGPIMARKTEKELKKYGYK